MFHTGHPIALGLVGLYSLYSGIRDMRSGVALGRWTRWRRDTSPVAYYSSICGRFVVFAVFGIASIVELTARS